MGKFSWKSRARSIGLVSDTQDLKAQARSDEKVTSREVPANNAHENAVLLAKLKDFYAQLSAPFVNKEEDARIITLALIAKEHVMFVSEPGTAKSALAVRAGDLTKAKVFKKQLSKFTDPAELFGPPDAKAIMEQGTYRTVIKGMLPEADIAFLDEIFRGGSAIRDTLLSIMNERKMFNGQETINVPVRTIISATNFVSYDEEDQALYDRFLLRHFILPLDKGKWGSLIDAAWKVEFKGTANVKDPVLSLSDLDAIYDKVGMVDSSNVKEMLLEIFEKVEERQKIHVTDRRKGRALKMIAANALLEGRMHTAVEDLIVLKYIIPRDEEEAATITAMLEDLISPVNHTQRLSRLDENTRIAIEQIREHPEVVNDLDHDLASVAKASNEARKLMRMHSDKELRRNARALIKSTKELTMLLNSLKEERNAKADALTVIARNGVA